MPALFAGRSCQFPGSVACAACPSNSKVVRAGCPVSHIGVWHFLRREGFSLKKSLLALSRAVPILRGEGFFAGRRQPPA
jgi:hypothetical protein